MFEADAAEQLAALGHPARLRLLRTLMAAGTAGAPAGALARTAELAPNAATFHLDRLRLAGLAQRHRCGREQRYVAEFAAVRALLDYLGETCCTEADAAPCGPVCGDAAQSAAPQYGEPERGEEESR